LRGCALGEGGGGEGGSEGVDAGRDGGGEGVVLRLDVEYVDVGRRDYQSVRREDNEVGSLAYS
jgi:hypothetical protein